MMLTDWSSMESLLLITGKHTLSQNIHCLHPLHVNLSETEPEIILFLSLLLFHSPLTIFSDTVRVVRIRE